MRKWSIIYESILGVGLLLFFGAVLFWHDSSITGYVSFPVESISLQEVVSTNTSFVLTASDPGKPFTISSLRVSGKVVGDGKADIYLLDKGRQLLVYSNGNVKKRYEGITGMTNKDDTSLIGAVVGLDNEQGIEIIIEDKPSTIQKSTVTSSSKDKINETAPSLTPSAQQTENQKIENNTLGGLQKPTGGVIAPTAQDKGTKAAPASGEKVQDQPEKKETPETRLTLKKEASVPAANGSIQKQTNATNFFTIYDQPENASRLSVQNKCLETCLLDTPIQATELKFTINVDPGTAFYLEKITYS